MSEGDSKPEWTPKGADPAFFTTTVRKGNSEQKGGRLGNSFARLRSKLPDPEWLIEGVLAGDRMRLARAITLVESKAPAHLEVAREVLTACLPHAGKARRIGISGVPGAGKSTFIEAFGLRVCERGEKIAVLAVDPSSSRSGGSVLGDKTRMELLSRHPNSFIRPSPSAGTLGGVASRTKEAMILVEAAGYGTVLVETVGVGQSEIAVRSLVDFFLLLQIAGAGDELQGIKKGVIEIADAIAVNKADGDNITRARSARGEYGRILHFLEPYTEGWEPKAMTCSAISGKGLERIENLITDFLEKTKASGVHENERRRQNVEWFRTLLKETVLNRFFADEATKTRVEDFEKQVADGTLPVSSAVESAIQ
ncbi:methylmalonyl Co-A mutase-associated GTPase MeaB [Puniceicoccus vermicola]|uniref:Methylmalonyl Co-A mutase-associated GTPase MeaB n=1 Tax=Puniceicoccus vermicola TaxID=388746 RepID=A0A7X1B191_9BACT|nr:methylmalonyl Co-A mutase-associated GTPase MeaB [Puniceicoccus vermicola]MBC2603758.1 methylmalonyl Co-A mutase-associated GTPase MeaB [Puniceicoccus vermicola]